MAAAAEEEAQQVLERYFEKNARNGVTLSSKQLAAYAKKLDLPVTEKSLRDMRSRFKFSAYFAKFRSPLKYMSLSHPKFGIVQESMLLLHSPVTFLSDFFLFTSG
jgi:hypothetical protein